MEAYISHIYMCEVAWSTGQQTSVFFTYSYSTGCYKVKVFFNFVQLCLAKGFICEYCKDGKDVIFPFMLNRVVQCLGALLSYNFLNRGLDC